MLAMIGIFQDPSSLKKYQDDGPSKCLYFAKDQREVLVFKGNGYRSTAEGSLYMTEGSRRGGACE